MGGGKYLNYSLQLKKQKLFSRFIVPKYFVVLLTSITFYEESIKLSFFELFVSCILMGGDLAIN